MKKTICYILLAFATCACIYPYDAEMAKEAPERLVVSGDILIGEESVIDLSYVMPLSSDISLERKAPPEAVVLVKNEKGQYLYGKKVKQGRYVIDTRYASENSKYRLYIKLDDGREYQTPLEAVNGAPRITDLSYTVDNTHLRLYCSLTGRSSAWNYSLEYDEDWEYHAYFIPDLLFVNGGYEVHKRFKDFYNCWGSRSSVEPCFMSTEGLSENRIEKNNFLSIPRADYRLMDLYSINVTVRGLSTDARVYLEHLRDGSVGTGDLFTPTPSEMRGNITCITDPEEQVVGYVSVCKRASKRIFISSTNVYQSIVDPGSLLFFPEPDEDGNYNLENLFLWDSPVYFDGPAPGYDNVQWAPKRCVDCRVWGGTKNKPDWWPNDDE